MLKIEYIWRELLFRAIEKKDSSFSITELSRKFGLSTSVVSYALGPLRDMGIVEIGKTASNIRDSERLLYFWATRRNLNKEIIYKTYNPGSVFEIESLMPPNVVPTAYSACRLLFNINPSDYGKAYFYSNNIDSVSGRFPQDHKKEANIYILKDDEFFKNYPIIPKAQVYADLWNLPEWYAKEFSENLLNKIKKELGV